MLLTQVSFVFRIVYFVMSASAVYEISNNRFCRTCTDPLSDTTVRADRLLVARLRRVQQGFVCGPQMWTRRVSRKHHFHSCVVIPKGAIESKVIQLLMAWTGISVGKGERKEWPIPHAHHRNSFKSDTTVEQFAVPQNFVQLKIMSRWAYKSVAAGNLHTNRTRLVILIRGGWKAVP
jgi:hypothetical protein